MWAMDMYGVRGLCVDTLVTNGTIRNPVAQKGLHGCTIVLFSLLSPHPADPTLTTGNLIQVVNGLERRWEDLAYKLNMRYKKITEIKRTDHNDIQKMEAVVDDYVRYHPLRSWDRVASALREMRLYQQGDVVIAKYIRGI